MKRVKSILREPQIIVPKKKKKKKEPQIIANQPIFILNSTRWIIRRLLIVRLPGHNPINPYDVLLSCCPRGKREMVLYSSPTVTNFSNQAISTVRFQPTVIKTSPKPLPINLKSSFAMKQFPVGPHASVRSTVTPNQPRRSIIFKYYLLILIRFPSTSIEPLIYPWVPHRPTASIFHSLSWVTGVNDNLVHRYNYWRFLQLDPR